MSRRPLLLIVLLLCALAAGNVLAQDDLRVLRLGYTEEPDMLVDYTSNTLLGWSMFRLHSQPQWGTTQQQEIVPLFD
ncbi:MAG: hypothetical protein HND48_02495 [Chloroflexi bacterium]|nr:hypothetical protein [Chloroflexota bacterium]